MEVLCLEQSLEVGDRSGGRGGRQGFGIESGTSGVEDGGCESVS